MGERLTSEWTETTEEAFGKNGREGRIGELIVIVEQRSWGWDVTDHGNDRQKQLVGIDITFHNGKWYRPYTADVKANLHNGNFMVETNIDGWLRNSKYKNDRVWHVENTTGWMAWYDRKDMIKYLEQKEMLDKGLVTLSVFDDIPCITKRKAKTIDVGDLL